MAFNFKNLDTEVRRYMEDEAKSDIANGTLYLSKFFSAAGKIAYPEKLIENIRHGNEETLAAALTGLFVYSYEKRKPNGGYTMAKVPVTANKSFAEGEFNRFYMRALCRKALDTGKQLKIYRAKFSAVPRADSELKINKFADALKLLNDLRNNPGTDTALGLPSGPNSGLSVELV